MKTRKIVDKSVKYLFTVVSWTSVVALSAMIIFVFFQGSQPFLAPTAENIQIVVRNIPAVTINGETYENVRAGIEIPGNPERIQVAFEAAGELLEFEILVDKDAADPDRIITFPAELSGFVSVPEKYNFSLGLPSGLPGRTLLFNVVVPEPPLSIIDVLTGTEWRPDINRQFGILPMILATILSTIGAVILGVPIALLASLFITEFLRPKAGAFVRSLIDLLAGIPSVVYGFFGLVVVVPAIQQTFQSSSGSSLLAAMIILGIMILPTVVALSMTAFQSVPRTYREASLALGATRMQTSWNVVYPAANSGVLAGVVLGVSRAVGETFAVILVAGNSPQIPTALVEPVRTLTATIAIEMGYAAGRHSQMLFAVGIVLFVMILLLNAVIMRLQHRRQEASR